VRKYNDAIYYGEIKEWMRNGEGIMKYKSGRVYEGTWRHDLREGRGFEWYSNSNTYQGFFSKGN
jgi:hypothetical protein